MRMPNTRFSVACLLGAGLLSMGAARAQEKENAKKLSVKWLPAAVRKTAEEQSKGALIRGVSKEVDAGKTVYEVEMKVDGHTKDIIIAADGTLMIAEEEMALASLPEAVKAAIEKHAGKGRILLVEAVTQGGALAYYEAQVQTGRKRSEIKVGPDGSSIAEE